ncbi:hypothetical protein CHR29_20680 [Pseudomonas monteilii]|uniref:hypothetical protein n=1 Tax=Pseudomonas TaxID=286 RepID=UPI000EF6F33E|nr:MULTISPECIES: hypothetical protein [Pseudomonas]AYN17438.1 hypothetical protein CHR29_20680 [Pseudomonas monteilii]AYN98943.1 hypothetical protein D8767_08180 [Pseudomonas sp. LTGT-11-2Z]MCE0874184.1 hypothetical protein [Pseudomonas monteilii]MCE0926805.1 hypothetical protein [Pseudomonas monteilii]MCE0932369.1 hypothetical protein [Pseudomonas monteilii]
MPFIVINSSNNFDPIHQNEYATEQVADAAARKLLEEQPAAIVRTAQVIKRYSAKVTVSVEEVEGQPVQEVTE